jgi:hypothetical protein
MMKKHSDYFEAMTTRVINWRALIPVCAMFTLAEISVYASIPASNGVITGCYVTPTGALGVIDTSVTPNFFPAECKLCTMGSSYQKIDCQPLRSVTHSVYPASMGIEEVTC